MRDTLRCDRNADAKGVAVDPACTGKASASLPGAFSLADAKGPCPGIAATVENDIATFESNANTVLGNAAAPRRASKCDARKIGAMGKDAAKLLACESMSATMGIDPGLCDLSADRNFQRAIYRAQRLSPQQGGDCSTGNYFGDLEDVAVYPFVSTVVDHLASPSGAFLADSPVF